LRVFAVSFLSPTAVFIISLDQVDSACASALKRREVDIEREGSTEEVVPVGPIGRVIIGVVSDPSAVIVTHDYRGAFSGKVSFVETLDPHGPVTTPVACPGRE